MLCKNCGSEITENVKFCPVCGTKVDEASSDGSTDNSPGEKDELKVENTETPQGDSSESKNLCAYCGKEIPQDAVLCPYCGKAVKQAKGKAKKKGVILLVVGVLLVMLIAVAALRKSAAAEGTPESRITGRWTTFAVKGDESDTYAFTQELNDDQQTLMKTLYLEFYENHTGKISIMGIKNVPLTWSFEKTLEDDTDCFDEYSVTVETDSGNNTIEAVLVRTKGSKIEGKILITIENSSIVLEKTSEASASSKTYSSTVTNSSSTTTSRQSSSVTSGQKNALRKAGEYLNAMAFSYTGLIDQLEYEGFSTAEATYAADNCGANWKEQAVKKAKEYLNAMAFSESDLIDQLEYEGFTHDQAVYGVDKAY